MCKKNGGGIIERPTIILRTILQRFSDLWIRDVSTGILIASPDASPCGRQIRMIHTKGDEIYA